jgi:phage host-nuclease inhibitor protein Gam
MSKNRIKIAKPVILTRQEMERAMGEVREYIIEKTKLAANRDAKVTAIDDEFNPKIAAIDVKLKATAEALELWSDENPAEFGERKSIELLHGKLGYRIGQWKTETLKGWTWEKALKKAQELKGKFTDYIRTKHEINRDQLIIDRSKLTAEDREKIGVRIFQEEAFFIEPNVTEVEAV